MIRAGIRCRRALRPVHPGRRERRNPWRLSSVWRTLPAILLVIWSFGAGTVRPVYADGFRGATDSYARADYLRAVSLMSPVAARGNARPKGLLAFMYEMGFGVPQSYDAAADLYERAAVQGDP